MSGAHEPIVEISRQTCGIARNYRDSLIPGTKQPNASSLRCDLAECSRMVPGSAASGAALVFKENFPPRDRFVLVFFPAGRKIRLAPADQIRREGQDRRLQAPLLPRAQPPLDQNGRSRERSLVGRSDRPTHSTCFFLSPPVVGLHTRMDVFFIFFLLIVFVCVTGSLSDGCIAKCFRALI